MASESPRARAAFSRIEAVHPMGGGATRNNGPRTARIGLIGAGKGRPHSAKLALPDADAEIEPLPVSGGGRIAETEVERLSAIIERFNAECARLFDDPERIVRRIREDVAPKVADDPAYQNARLNTPQTAKLEHARALEKVMIGILGTTWSCTSSSPITPRSSRRFRRRF